MASESPGQGQRGRSREGRRWMERVWPSPQAGPLGHSKVCLTVLRAKMGRPGAPSSVREKGLWLQGALPLFSWEQFPQRWGRVIAPGFPDKVKVGTVSCSRRGLGGGERGLRGDPHLPLRSHPAGPFSPAPPARLASTSPATPPWHLLCPAGAGAGFGKAVAGGTSDEKTRLPAS